ncbi:hypothetical protein P9112_007438 [Eukaryota sp. TZLM1-RC]
MNSTTSVNSCITSIHETTHTLGKMMTYIGILDDQIKQRKYHYDLFSSGINHLPSLAAQLNTLSATTNSLIEVSASIEDSLAQLESLPPIEPPSDALSTQRSSRDSLQTFKRFFKLSRKSEPSREAES